MSKQDIAARFAHDTAEHAMTIRHDDDVHRHIAFYNPKHSWCMWFELTTVPGALIFDGDIGSYVFRRTNDMFRFFRGSAWQGRPNIHYWAEKLTSSRDSVKEFSAAAFEQVVKEQFFECARYGGVPIGTGRALREEVLRFSDEMDDREAHDAIERFEHKGFSFSDTWEWDFRDYNPRFLWACEAIVWGIAQYDAHAALPRPITSATPARLRKAVALKCTPLAVAAPEPAAEAPSAPAAETAPAEPVGRPSGRFVDAPAYAFAQPIVEVQLPEPAEVTS